MEGGWGMREGRGGREVGEGWMERGGRRGVTVIHTLI